MNQKKVLLLTFWYPDEKQPVKGVFILEHARAIKALGCDVYIFAVKINDGKRLLKRNHEYFIDSFGIPNYVVTIESALYKFIYANIPLLVALVIRTFYRYIQPHFQPDIIHSNILSPCAIAGHFLSKKLKKPHIITEHWSKLDKFFRLNLFSRLGVLAYNRSASITVVSDWLRHKMIKYVDDPEKITIIPNVIDSVFSFKSRRKSDVINFVAVASWKPPKRIDLILESMNEFAGTTNKPVIFHIIGEGVLLDSGLTDKNLFSFEIVKHGFLPKPEVSEIMQQSDYFIHCSEVETFSVVIAEALCTGLPVLASKVGAIPELINDNNGLLCDNTSESWRDGISRITSRQFDSRKISEDAIEKFSILKIGRQFLDVYNSAISGSPG